ncbi:MAG: IPT/TIG domain-containing protein [Acidobacteriota bacterium]
MRRISTAVLAIALVAFYLACSADAPAPTPPNRQPTPGPNGTPLQVRLFTNNANPLAGNCTLIQAIVSLNGANVPDGTGVAFSTDFGIFQQNAGAVVSVTTQGSAAVTALCSSDAGLANVRASATVSGQTGTATLPISFQPTAAANPFFSSCSPSFASNTGGTDVTFSGGRFFGSAATTRVTFTAAGVTREGLVTAVTPTGVTVTTPAFPEAISPSVPVNVTITLGTNTANPFVLQVPNCFAFGTASSSTPTVTAILPSSGPNSGNTRATIVGSGFSSPLQVFFGTQEATVLSVSFNQIVVLTPVVPPGSPNLNANVEVRVHEVTSGTDATFASFRYVEKVNITSVSNNVQRVDVPFSQVTIFGRGFEAPVAVGLAGVAAQVISVSATEIIVLPGAPLVTGCTDVSGAVSVVNINTGDFDTTEGTGFTYLIAATKPIITGVSPGSAAAGTPVSISGANFSGGNGGVGRIISVLIGGRPASFSVLSDGTIAATMPDLARTAPACTGSQVNGDVVPNGTADIVLTANVTGCATTSTAAVVYLQGCLLAPTPAPAAFPAGR